MPEISHTGSAAMTNALLMNVAASASSEAPKRPNIVAKNRF
jgi:hypothetical protein